MKYIIKEKKLSEVELFLLRRVSWDKILEGLNDGIKWSERRYERYKNNPNEMNSFRYHNMVMGVLMDYIVGDLIEYEENSIDLDLYRQIERYLSELFSDVIKNSYNKVAD